MARRRLRGSKTDEAPRRPRGDRPLPATRRKDDPARKGKGNAIRETRKARRCRFDIFVLTATVANLRRTGYSGETSFKFGPTKDNIRVTTADYALQPDPTPGSLFGKTIVFGPPDVGIQIYNSDQEGRTQDCDTRVSVRIWAQASSRLGGENTTFEFECDGEEHQFPHQVYVTDKFRLGIGIGYVYGLSFKIVTRCLP